MKFEMLISIKISRNSAFLSSAKPRMLFTPLKNVKMPTIELSMKNVLLPRDQTSFKTSRIMNSEICTTNFGIRNCEVHVMWASGIR